MLKTQHLMRMEPIMIPNPSFVLMIVMWFVSILASPTSAHAAVSTDIRELIESARGAPAPLCACAARAVYNWGWIDAPASPLGQPVGERTRERRHLSDEDVAFLLTSLDTPDPCVRELAVRLVAGVRREEVTNGLLQRLTAADSSLRMTAALGLGIAEPRQAVEPLMKATRDDAAGVRANAVWALGRIGDTRAVSAATTTLADRSPLVRQAAAGTLGHLEAKSAAPSLARALKDDDVAAVRRTAAWAITQIEAEDATRELTTALQKDEDADVREMCAWALGNLDRGSTATSVLLSAAKSDDDAEVRETAVSGRSSSRTAAPR
jgi:HEAT repeat protein